MHKPINTEGEGELKKKRSNHENGDLSAVSGLLSSNR